jgi:hypothetical protein
VRANRHPLGCSCSACLSLVANVVLDGLRLNVADGADKAAIAWESLFIPGLRRHQRVVRNRLLSVLPQTTHLFGVDLVECAIQFGDDMELVEDVEGLGAVTMPDAQMGLSHVAADELNRVRQFFERRK